MKLPVADHPTDGRAETLSLTLKWMENLLSMDEEISHEAIRDAKFSAALKQAYSALAGGALEFAESDVELAIERFAEIQNRAFLNRRVRQVSYD